MANVTIIPADNEDYELGKDFPIPATIKAPCPTCGGEVVSEFPEVSYPKVGKPFDIHLYCNKCREEWAVSIVLDLTVRLG